MQEEALLGRASVAPAAELRRDDVVRLAEALSGGGKVATLTGAGCSTESGIPDYRSPGGLWTNHKPVYYADFMRNLYNRQRYWARAMGGWRRWVQAYPNAAHKALARLEAEGIVSGMVTQNVDGLHQAAGSHYVIELHGNNDMVVCMGCRSNFSRTWMQLELHDRNQNWTARVLAIAPDGDAALDREDFADFVVPDCPACGGIIKPDVVFFGESVPTERVERCYKMVDEADSLFVAGSSLTVWSGYRFVRRAAAQGKPVFIANIGPTRADDLATLKIEARVGDLLGATIAALTTTSQAAR